jgi:hypothetical protein
VIELGYGGVWNFLPDVVDVHQHLLSPLGAYVPASQVGTLLFLSGFVPGHTRLICSLQSLPLGASLVLEVIFRLEDSPQSMPVIPT